MKNIMINYDAESIRWMGYHMALKKFFEGVAGLPNVPANEDETHGKNVKVIYATPSSAFTKYVMPLVNGLTQRPIITYYLNSEETLDEVAGTPFLINRYAYKDENGDYKQISFRRPLMKSLTYNCNIFTNKMSDCDYILTLLELNCDKFKPYSCRVNGRPTQFYLDKVETGTPTDYEGKKFISSSFTMTTPLASIFPAEIETDVDIIKTINTYLGGEDSLVISGDYLIVDSPVKEEMNLYYEYNGSEYVLTTDTEPVDNKIYYRKSEINILNKYS